MKKSGRAIDVKGEGGFLRADAWAAESRLTACKVGRQHNWGRGGALKGRIQIPGPRGFSRIVRRFSRKSSRCQGEEGSCRRQPADKHINKYRHDSNSQKEAGIADR